MRRDGSNTVNKTSTKIKWAEKKAANGGTRPWEEETQAPTGLIEAEAYPVPEGKVHSLAVPHHDDLPGALDGEMIQWSLLLGLFDLMTPKTIVREKGEGKKSCMQIYTHHSN